VTDFVIEYGGNQVDSIKRAFKAAARAGLPRDTSPHILRHSAAVHMIERGVAMSEVSQYLAHTSTKLTERVYARFSPDYLRRAASALE
jgi:integrase